MRGIHSGGPEAIQSARITPAHAGNTRPRRDSWRTGQDHPRTCGEYSFNSTSRLVMLGSPPHMRGILEAPHMFDGGNRITPAHAGNTSPTARRFTGFWDHPRTCGEYSARRPHTAHLRGSPPHMRGIRTISHYGSIKNRITPAHAGNTGFLLTAFQAGRDHPRTCGEYLFPALARIRALGSPPHMRGIPILSLRAWLLSGITPAHAGNTVAENRVKRLKEDHPRTCGEYSVSAIFCIISSGSPPHMRGIPHHRPGDQLVLRITPAHAGNTGIGLGIGGLDVDHPRTCGEYKSSPGPSW